MKNKLITLIILFLSVQVYGQKLKISISDSTDRRPLRYASVIMTNLSDTMQKKEIFADKEGNVEVAVKANTQYLLHARFLSYIGKDITVPVGENAIHEDIRVDIFLSPEVKGLEGVTVTSIKQTIKSVPGGFVYNVDKETANLNVDAANLLRKIPGMSPCQSCDLKLMGKNVSIWVDGRPLALAGADLQNYLKLLSAHDVKSINVFIIPPSVYDASGGSIIEIITNKNVLNGLFGRVSGSLGTHDKYGSSVALIYKSKRISGNYRVSFDHSNYFQRERSTQENFNTGDSLFRYENQFRQDENPFRGLTVSIQNDYAFDKKNVLGLVLRYNNFSALPSEFNNDLQIYNRQGELFSEQRFNRQLENSSNVYFAGLNYRSALKKKGASVVLDGSIWKRNAVNQFRQSLLQVDKFGSPLRPGDYEKNNASQDFLINTYSATFKYPFSDSLGMSMGVKYSQFRIDGDFRNQKSNSADGIYLTDNRNSFLLGYNEDIFAAFVNFTAQRRRWQYQAGVRFEGTSTRLETWRAGAATDNDNDFSNLFPSIGLVYKIDKRSSLNLAYGKRISRVSYSQMNPLDQRKNPNTIIRGNPQLRASVSDDINLNLTFQPAPAQMYMLSVSYTANKNPYSWLTLPDTVAGNYVYAPFNHKAWNYLNINLYFQQRPNKWLEFTGNMFLAMVDFDLSDLGLPEPRTYPAFGANGSVRVKLDKSTTIELSGAYTAPAVTALGRGYGSQFVDIAMTRSFMKERLNLSVRLSDMFDINQMTIENDASFLSNRLVRKNETRVGRIFINYKFGKQRSNKISGYSQQEDGRFSN